MFDSNLRPRACHSSLRTAFIVLFLDFMASEASRENTSEPPVVLRLKIAILKYLKPLRMLFSCCK